MRRFLVPTRSGRGTMDPFSFMDNAMRAMFQEFSDSTQDNNRPMIPSMDVYRKDGIFTLVMDLPGVDKDDIDLKVYRDRVEVKAHRSTQECLKEEDCAHSERFYGSISRTVSFPTEVDCDSVQASYVDGVLKVQVKELQAGGEGKTIAISDGSQP